MQKEWHTATKSFTLSWKKSFRTRNEFEVKLLWKIYKILKFLNKNALVKNLIIPRKAYISS